MESEGLYAKYKAGRHWENHPTMYAENFANFLKGANFKGRIVDIGCSKGRDVDVFTQSGFDATGIDISAADVEAAKKKYPRSKFEVQNAEKLAFRDNSVGAYFMINVIHYVKMREALGEIFRTLKPNGYIFIHFNVDIQDKEGAIEYHHDKEDIKGLISNLKIVQKNIFERKDTVPVEHTHKIMELILQKPNKEK